jgi:hypothetical protein
VRPYSAGTSTLQETPSFAWRTNARRQAPLIAELGRRKARCIAARFLTPPVENRTCGFYRILLSTLVLFLVSSRPSSSFGIFAHAFLPRREFTSPLTGIISLRIRVSLPHAPALPRLGAFAKGSLPRVDGVTVLRLLCPVRLSPLASSFREAFPPHDFPTALHIHRGVSRVRCGRLKRNDGGGVLLAAPSALCGFPVCIQGRSG